MIFTGGQTYYPGFGPARLKDAAEGPGGVDGAGGLLGGAIDLLSGAWSGGGWDLCLLARWWVSRGKGRAGSQGDGEEERGEEFHGGVVGEVRRKRRGG